MPVDFFFDPPSYSIPKIGVLADFKWEHVPDREIAKVVAAEEQYLGFHLYMLGSLRFTEPGRVASPPYAYPLGLSVRAGAVKAAVLLAASICEAVLRSHAEKRDYALNPDPKKRTFGNVLGAWKDAAGAPYPDVAPIWEILQELHAVRNNIHLYKAAGDPEAQWAKVLEDEEEILQGSRQAIEHLATLRSP